MRFGADLMAHDVFSVFLCALSLAHECQDEASAVWQLQLQSALSANPEPPKPGICASPAPEDYDKPISAVLKSFLDRTVGAYSGPPLIGAALVQLAANRRI